MKENKIAKSTLSVTAVLIFVKFVGIIKQAVIAAYFGASGEMDKYLLASEFVTQIGTLVFSALSVSFLTMYVQVKAQKDKEKAQLFISNTFKTFVPIAVCVVIIIFLCADIITIILAPGYDAANRKIVADYIRIVSIVIINACITNICTGILEGNKQFFWVKFCGLFQSACLMAACVFFSKKIGASALLIGFIVYFILENIYLLILVKKFTGFKMKKMQKDSRMLELLKLSGPLFVSNAVVEINNIADKAIASNLSEGNISSLSYSNYLFNSLYAIIIGSVCSVCFSYFSTYIAEGKVTEFRKLLSSGVRNLLLILMPIVIVIILYAQKIVYIIYGRGEFDLNALSMTTAALQGYTVGIIFIAVRDLLVRAHYAFQDTRQPMVNAIAGVVVNIGLSIMFSMKFGVFGISFASSLSYILVSVISYFTLKRHLKKYVLFEDKKYFIRLIISGIGCGGIGAFMEKYLEISNVFFDFVIKAGIVCVIYVIILFIFRCEELLEVLEIVKNKVRCKNGKDKRK